MKGYVEESPEKKAMDALTRAAKKYAAAYMLDLFGADAEKVSLGIAAEDYYKALYPPPPPKKKRKKKA